jgi:translocation and assembly module TamB
VTASPNQGRFSRHFHISRPTRWVAYVFAALVALYLALVAILSTSWFNRFALDQTRAALEQVTGARVEIASLVISPWAFQATLGGIVLHGNEAPPELPLLIAPRLVVRLSPQAALRWRLRLRSVDLQGAQVHLYTRANGSTNLPGPPAASGGGAGSIDDLLDLGIRRLVVAHSSVSWDNREWPLNLSASDVSVVLGFRSAQYTGSVSASAVNVASPSVKLPPTTFAVRLELAKNRLALSSLVWRSPAVNGTGSVVVHWLPAPAWRFSFQIDGNARPVAALLRQNAIRGGTFSARGDGSYSGGVASVRGHIEARRLSVQSPQFSPPPANISTDFSLNGSRAELTRLQASVLGGTARGSVTATSGPRTPTVKASLNLQNLDLKAALQSVQPGSEIANEFPLSGSITGKLNVSGSARAARADFDVTIQATSPTAGRDPVSGSLRGSATLAPAPSITVDEGRLQTAASVVTFHGEVGNQADLTFQVQTASFDEWRAPAEKLFEAPVPLVLHSLAEFSGTLTGTRDRPLVRGQLQLGGFVVRGSSWTGLTASIAASPEEIQVSSGRLYSSGNTLNLELTAGLEDWLFGPNSQLTLSASAQNTSIAALRLVLDINAPLDGRLTGDITLAGTRDLLAGRCSIDVTQGNYASETFKSFKAGVSIENGAWNVTHFDLVKGNGHATGKGGFDPHAGTFSVLIEGSGFQLADFSTLASAGVPTGTGGIAGTVGFRAQVDGSLDNPSGKFSIKLQQISVSGVNLGTLTATANLKDHQAALDAQLQGAGEGVNLQSSLKTTDDWPLQISARYSDVRLDPWLREAGFSNLTANLEASGSLQGSAELRHPRIIELKSNVQALEVSLADLKWRNSQPFQLALNDRKASLTAFELRGPSTQFKIQGEADLGSPSKLNLTADGLIDPSILHAFDPDILTAGSVRIQLKAQGRLQDPSLYGSLHMEKLSLGYPGIPLRLADLTGDIELQGDRVVIRSLASTGGPATVRFTGGATLNPSLRYNATVEFQHVRADFPVDFTSVLSGALRLSGTRDSAAVTGDVTVEQMFVGEDFNLLSWLDDLENQSPPGLVGGPAPVSSRVRLDVHIGSSPTVNVESHELTATASVDLSLRGTLADPVAYGNVHIISGQAVVRQTAYSLSRGDIIMANPLRTAPTLDIEAKTRIQSHDLVLRISGPADRPSISYRSDPPLPTPDILALLAFGYTNENQLMGANGRSSLGTQSAGALLSQALSSRTSSRITRLFGLSRISIDPNPSSLGGARVTVAEQLARNFTVTYITTTGGVYERIIQVEWDVSENISVLGVRDQNGVFGLELDFRHRFK